MVETLVGGMPMKPVNTLACSAREFKNTRSLVQISMLLALEVVLNYSVSFSIGNYLRITFGYLPVAAAGALFGPFAAMSINGLSDIIMFYIKPMGGYYHPGFLLSALLSGLVYGLVFYRREIRFQHILIARLIVGLFINLGLNTVWLMHMYGTAYVTANLPSRTIKAVIEYPVSVLLLLPLIDRVKRIKQ